MYWRIIMRNKAIILMSVCFALVSCIEPEAKKKASSGAAAPVSTFTERADSSGVAAKNFAQINNTFATLTGIPMGDISAEYELIKMQLPSTGSLESLNGFNQIASTRLAFAYCDGFIDLRPDLSAMENDIAVTNLIDGFIDINPSTNDEHKIMFNELMAVMNNDDSLINDNNAANRKVKLLKLSCTAILTSSYVTLI